MARSLQPLLLCLCFLSPAAFCQGTGTPTIVAGEQEEADEQVSVGAGTTAATTTGASGPKNGKGTPEQARRSYSCYQIDQAEGYDRCFQAISAEAGRMQQSLPQRPQQQQQQEQQQEQPQPRQGPQGQST